jgi:hypothetical protein
MDKSPQQFPTLLSELVARFQRALKTSNEIPALGLTPTGEVKLSLGVPTPESGASKTLTAIQIHLQEIASKGEIEAACVAYPDYKNQAVIAYLENAEQYCIRYSIPVVQNVDGLSLDINNISDEDGTILIFGDAPETDA